MGAAAEPEPEQEPEQESEQEPGAETSGVVQPLDIAPTEEDIPDGYSEEDVRELFNKCDADGSGCISPDEFRDAMRELSPGMPAEKLEEGVTELDTDGDGEITWAEFSTWWMNQCRVQQAESSSTTPSSVDAMEVAKEVEKIASMGDMVKTAMTVNRMAVKLKNKAAEAKNKRTMRQIFVSYAEAFGEKMAEAQMIRDAFEKIDADKSGFIDGDELRMIAKELDFNMTEADIAAALHAMDENGDNEIEFEEFRDWWVLQSSQPQADGGPMSAFKKKLAESTARTVMEFDWATFAQVCKECSLMGKQDMKTRRIQPAGALLPKKIECAFRKALHEDYDPVAEATAEAEIVRNRKGTLSRKEEQLEQQRMKAWQKDRMRFDPFFVAMGTIAAEMFEDDAPILQMDKLIRRIETSGGSRAAKWFDRAEKSFAKMAYEDALKDFDKAISLDDTSCKYFSSRAAAHAAMQDWKSMMADAQQTIDLVDRYEGGLVTPDELISLHNFKNLAETFYSPPAWLHGQIRQYELRLKDEAIAQAAESAATPRSAHAVAQQVGQQQEETKRAAEAAKQQRRASARPDMSAVMSDLHGEVKRSAQAPGGAVSLIDYAASLLDDYPAPSKGDHGSRLFLTENYSLALGALRGMKGDATVTEVTGEDMIQCIESGGVTMTDQEKARVLEQMGLTSKTSRKSIPLTQLVSLTNDHSRPVSAHRVRSPSPEGDKVAEDGMPQALGDPPPTGKSQKERTRPYKNNLTAQSFRPPRREKRVTGGSLPKNAIDTPPIDEKRRGSQ